ncbi:hypothetical protein NNJEOMEG_01732 [Fundidesulfovibrio magnetotacticus]|uniref:Uncharacterized protein n=1 Tax=Fundidesulfovibrio magnetotacticus TaxID=2730080 RepID=A0A6V8LQ83_9BACT|nr:hypothetical protein [Fundidesulfovibrio magnetotacticus]GFK93894.1 hypothetical protein NNJEOMEG_01732 [Fundidesulfovibrio magnetotacticus]
MKSSFPLLLLASLMACSFIMPPDALCSTLKHELRLGAGEEYNSNVNEKPKAQHDFSSVISAVGSANLESTYLTASAKIDGTYNIYALGNRADEFKGTAQVKGTGNIIKEFLFLEGEGQFQQVFSNLARGETNPTDSTRNQVNQNTVTGRIYVTPRLTDRLSLKAGFQYTAIIYNQPERNKQGCNVFALSNYELTPNLSLILEGDGGRQDSQTGWFERVVLGGGFLWTYSQDGSIQIKVGPRFTRYDQGDFTTDIYWDARLVHSFKKLQLTADTSSKYVENPSSRYTSRQNSAGASLAWTEDRLTLQAKASYSTLSGKGTQNSEQVSLGLSASYELTPRLKLKASGTRELSTTDSGSLTRWYADLSGTYDLGHDFSLEGYCKFKFSDSSASSSNNYTVNIVGLRLKKQF